MATKEKKQKSQGAGKAELRPPGSGARLKAEVKPVVEDALDSSGRPRILVIDDDLTILIFVRALLQANNFDVETAETAMEGLVKYRRYRPDLVILDVNLPGEDGFTICQRFKRLTEEEQQEALRNPERIQQRSIVPIIFLSGRHSESDIRQALEVGGDSYVMKPFAPEVLLAKVYYFLRKTENPTGS